MKPQIYNAKSGEQVCLRKKGDTYFITKIGVGSFAQMKKEKEAKELYDQWCKEEDKVGEKKVKEDKKQADQSPSFSNSDWTKAIDQEVIKYDNKTIGFSFGKNNLGKSIKAGISEINSNEELKNKILSKIN